MRFWKGFTSEEIKAIKEHAPKFVYVIKEFEDMERFVTSEMYQEKCAEVARKTDYGKSVKTFAKNINDVSFFEGQLIYENMMEEYIIRRGDDFN